MSQETPAVVCKGCATRVKDWNGADPKCGFVNGGFDGLNNWMCMTAGKIRKLCERSEDSCIHHTCPENQHYATVSTLDFKVLPEDDAEGVMNAQPVCLWVGWYKSRGRTEAMWLMFENQPPRPPTEEECLKILEHYAK